MGQTLSDKGRDITAVKYSEIVVIPSIGPYGHSNPSNILRIILNFTEDKQIRLWNAGLNSDS